MKTRTKSNQFQVYNASAGSGKTFTLVKEYLKIIILSNNIFKFQEILAITFTNKAAAEMKARIITSLRNFSDPIMLKKPDNLFTIICEELNLEPSFVQTKAERILREILNNYAAFNITTIDSFTYKLIRSFAFDLGLSLNFEVEMDAQSLLNEAVDVLISRIGEDENLTKTLIDFSLQKANEDKSWDIALDLKTIAKLLLNEDDILHVNKIAKRPLEDFIALKNKIYKSQKIIENRFEEIGLKGFTIINTTNLVKGDFSHRGALYNHFSKLKNLKLKDLLFAGQLHGLVEKNYHFSSGKASVSAKQEIDTIKAALIHLYYESKKLYETSYQTYALNNLVVKSLIPLAVLRSINEVLTEIKEDNNIRLNAEFNQLISAHLKEQPIAFIYEKIGERFRHYFIDEMQDTSIMQWENLIPLLKDVLESETEKGEKGSLMLVGDAKQAIYRWRGGKAEQFIDLAKEKENNPFSVTKNVALLDTNFRSYSQIINFNNNFFSFLAKHLKNEAYRDLYEKGNAQLENNRKGGFVQLSFLEGGFIGDEKNSAYPTKILEIINSLDKNFKKKDICIIVRTKKQGVAIANYLTEHKIPITSSETLLLQNAPKVNFIIDLLYVLQEPKDEEHKLAVLHFLHHHFSLKMDLHEFLSQFVKLENKEFFEKLATLNSTFTLSEFETLAFYDCIEMIIRAFNLTKTSNAYLQFFLDVILDFSNKKAEGISSFLTYWEEKKEKLSIVVPDGQDAVKIMTIHKSKGLEFPVVIFSFDLGIYNQIRPVIWYQPLDEKAYQNFETTLVNYSKTLINTGEVGEILYNERQKELELDNFNLVYVALTRASEQLYIINELKSQSDSATHFSHFFHNFLKEKDLWNSEKTVYEFGDYKRLSKNEKNEDNDIVSSIQEKFISSNWKKHNLNIVVDAIESEELKTEKSRKYGNLIHKLLAKVITSNDIESVILGALNKGEISKEESIEIQNLMHKVVLHQKLKQYFSKDVLVMNERAIMTNEEDNLYNDKGDLVGIKRNVLIPDRLVFKGDTVVIIDYKTGKPDKKYAKQLNGYAQVLQQMHYKVSAKLLVYIDANINVVAV